MGGACWLVVALLILPVLRVGAQTNLALNKAVTVSSTQNGGVLTPAAATDGNLTTRWGSNWTDNEWIYVDLGQSQPVGRVVLRWENAYGSSYKIQISDDAATWTDLKTVTGGVGGVDDLAVSGTGRYVRMLGITRGTGYGYSLWEFEVYTDPPVTGPPVQSANQTINLVFPVQGLAYAKVNVSPAPLSVTPTPPEGNSTPSVRNPTAAVTYQITFPPNTNITLSKNQFTGSDPNTDIVLSTVDYAGVTQSATAVTTLALNNATWNVVVKAIPSGGTNGNPPANWINDPYVSPAPPPASGAFAVTSPTGGTLITGTRRPTLAWAAVQGAVKYDIYLNVSRTDYDWSAPGRLLDRYTLLGTVTGGTSYVLQQDLPDRWTYQWYVVATNAANVTSQSGVGTFGIYQPVLTTVSDGVPVINGCRDLNKDGVIEPYEDWHNPPAVRAADLLSRMTLHQKAMQLFFNTQVYPEAGFGFGPFAPADLFNYQQLAAQSQLGIPCIALGDTIHGYKTVYPTQPGLAATRDPQLAWQVADVQRRESLAVGNRGTLSPLAEVGTKVLYPRIQEGCGEDADLAAAMMRAMTVGLQGGPEVSPGSMMITTKHWAGQGAGGETGTVYDGTTIWYHMRPWHAAIEAGVSSIMPGYGGSWLLATQGYGAGDDPGILAFLRGTMGYTGVICTDWLPSGDWTRACTNGSDVMGGADPAAMGTFETDVPVSRINEAVTRVLDLKFRMGVFEDPYGGNVNGTSAWHTGPNVATIHNAAVKSLTLLKNDGALPLRLPSGAAIVVDGTRADDPSCMVTWRSDFHENDFGSLTIYKAIQARAAQDGITTYGPRARTVNPVPNGITLAAAIVVVGESYYTHGTYWDKNSPFLPDDPIGTAHDTTDAPQYALIQQYRAANIPTIVICMLPRPYVLTNVANLADALMVVYRPGDEGGPAIAETLFGDHLPSGRTPWQLPRSTDQIGIDDAAHWQSQPDKWDLPYDMGASAADLTAIRAAIAAGQHVDPIYGNPLYQYGAGIQGFGLSDATPPAAFNLLTPTNGQLITGPLPAFTWQASSDAETGIQRYDLYLDDVLVNSSRKDTSYTLGGTTLGNGTHNWRVVAVNWANGTTTTTTSTFTVNDTVPPLAFLACLPANGTTVSGVDPVTFQWEQSTDTGTGIARYILQFDGADAATVAPTTYIAPTVDLAFQQPASASSTSFGTPGAAVDADPVNTRWSSAWTNVANPDAEWFAVDLGRIVSVKEVLIKWENAYGKEYLIQVSTDNQNWTTIYHRTNGTGGTEDLTGLSGVGRYVKMQGVKRALGYGYSMWDFQVFGRVTEQTTLVPPPAAQHTWQVIAVDGAGNRTSNSNGPFTLISQLPPLDIWRQSHFGTTNADDAVAGDTAAPTHDGIANLIKYALGLDPSVPATHGLPAAGIPAGSFALSFQRQKTATDITYCVEASNDLTAWAEIWNSTNHPYGGGNQTAEQVTVADPQSIVSAPQHHRFLHLKVTRP